MEVVNSNGVVMPFTTHRETTSQNRYKYTLVPGETYRYIATKDDCYHIADEFRLEDVANSIITIDFAQMDDWLDALALGTGKSSKLKDSIALDTKFSSSGERLWPDEQGDYLLCEGYSYTYTLTRHGYAGKSGTLDVTRDENHALVVADGSEHHMVTEDDGGGIVTVEWNLSPAPANPSINTGLSAPWPNFRGGSDNNAVTNAPVPTSAEEGTLYWANKLGSGIDSDAMGSPILVGGDLITYAGNKIYRVDTVTGEILATGTI